MNDQPCQLWPTHPVPQWLQTPLVILLLIGLGAVLGWTAGVSFTHFWHYKFKIWMDKL
jgi:hypothetical protein